MKDKKEPYKGDLATLFPGEEVPLDETGNNVMIVYPAPLSKIREYMAGWYSGVMEYYKGRGGMPLDPDGAPDTAKIAAMVQSDLPRAAPIIAGSMWELVRECCKPDPDDLPPDFVPAVAIAFVKVNFMDERRRKNWQAALEGLIQSVIGRRISISETFSRSLSPLATRLKKYFAAGAGTAGATASRIMDGAFPSSGTGSTAPQPCAETTEATESKIPLSASEYLEATPASPKSPSAFETFGTSQKNRKKS